MSEDTHTIHPIAGYTYVEREPQPEEDNSVTTRLRRLEYQFGESGIRRSVEALMLVEVHGFPHVLVLQVANAFYKLPGGYLDPSETDADGLITRLKEQIGIPRGTNFNASFHLDATPPDDRDVVQFDFPPTINDRSTRDGIQIGSSNPLKEDWQVKDCLSVWWRPNYDTFFYPYVPAHISQPKECKKFFLVELPPTKTFAVPVNMKLHAIPVYEFYDNAARYGPQFAGIPYTLSKYTFQRAAAREAKQGEDLAKGIQGILIAD
ncbi:hypothetical protein IAU59_002243 [Kwoniella sp. CBS 9459]